PGRRAAPRWAAGCSGAVEIRQGGTAFLHHGSRSARDELKTIPSKIYFKRPLPAFNADYQLPERLHSGLTFAANNPSSAVR
ncbi:MAG: hypothetical protein ACRDSH_09930, partial [Pseudonocardiaceae bacterium]